MVKPAQTNRSRFWLWLIRVIGVIVPRRLRADWKQEWEAELRHREALLVDWDRLNWRNKAGLFWRSTSAFWDALWMQPQRLEDEMFQDLRYGSRMLLKKPGFTLVAVLTLGLGTGANTAIFSVVNAVLLRPLPYQNVERLMMVWASNPARGEMQIGASEPDFADFRRESQSWESLAAFTQYRPALTGSGETEKIHGSIVTPDFFSALGISPALGRDFVTADAERGNRMVILSHGLWHRRFAGDPDLVGQQIHLSNAAYTVIGVLPEGFHPLSEDKDLYRPMSFDRLNVDRGYRILPLIGRLKEGVTLQQAQAEMSAIAGRLEAQYPDTNSGYGVRLVPLDEQVTGDARPGLLLLLGAVGLVLLIACTNIAGLLLAQAASREKEITIRLALGARRWRIIRQLMTEHAILSLAGGTAGLLLAYWGLGYLISVSPADLPRVNEASIDQKALVFSFAMTVLTALVFGLIPALQSTRPDLNRSLKERSPGGRLNTRNVRSALVIGEMALAIMLLAGAGLLIRSALALNRVDSGLNAEGVLTVPISAPASIYRNPKLSARFFAEVVEQVGMVNGVKSAGATLQLPFSGLDVDQSPFSIEGRPETNRQQPVSRLHVVSPHYFSTIGISLLEGRMFTDRDNAEAPGVVIINKEMERRFWPDGDAVGKRITQGLLLTPGEPAEREIVGVVGDVKHFGLAADTEAQMYVPHSQSPWPDMNLVLRADGDPLALAPAVRKTIQAISTEAPIAGLSTMNQILSGSVAQPRFRATLLGLFALAALVLAATGLYGVIAYLVSQRGRELGIRIAVGAQSTDILRLIVGEGLKLISAGVLVGLLGALALTRLLSGLLFGVAPTDPLTFVTIAVVMTAVALLACYVPARRATRVDPMRALRHE
jgi:putative ABC transport system permease protein